jgi:hypothetical protein
MTADVVRISPFGLLPDETIVINTGYLTATSRNRTRVALCWAAFL